MVDMALLDNLRPGATVISSDGKKVGRLYAVVIDSRDDGVTHVVVNAGPHFPAQGFGAPKLINLPVEEMADAREDKVILKCTKRKLSGMPEYAEWSFTKPAVSGVWQIGSWGIPVPAEIIHKRKFEREIMRGAHVWRVEPHTEIGDVDRILVNEQTEAVEALVIHHGLLFGHDVVLPLKYVTEMLDDVVHVKISDQEIEELEEFNAPPEP